MKFKLCDKIKIKLNMNFTFCRKFIKLNADQKKYKRALNKARNELDILNISTTLQKMKAGLAAVINNDNKLVYSSK